MIFTRCSAFALAATMVMLGACTTSDKPVNLGNGVRGYHIACGGLPLADASDCNDRARHICGDNGYTILKSEDPPYAHSERAWSLTTHDITISCNAAPPQLSTEQPEQ